MHSRGGFFGNHLFFVFFLAYFDFFLYLCAVNDANKTKNEKEQYY